MDEEKTVTQAAEAEPVAVPDTDISPATEVPVTPKPKRKRRTKAEIEADAKKAAAKARREARKAAKVTEQAAGEAVETVTKATKDAIEEGAKVAEKITRPRIPAPEIVLQYSGIEIGAAALTDAAVAQFRAVRKRARITDIKLYVKPEERAAYYVINGDFSGKVDF